MTRRTEQKRLYPSLAPPEVRESLNEFVQYLRRAAEENADHPDASTTNRNALKQVVRLLESVKDLIRLIDDYEFLSLWMNEVYPYVRREHRSRLKDLGALDTGGFLHLSSVLYASFNLGGYSYENPILKNIMKKLHKARTAPAREALKQRRPGSAQINELIIQGLNRGLRPKQIEQALADEKIALSPQTTRKRIERLKKSAKAETRRQE
jgi:hypothetical protein